MSMKSREDISADLARHYRLLRAQAGTPIPKDGWCAQTRVNGRNCFRADQAMTGLIFTRVLIYAKVYKSRVEAEKDNMGMEAVPFTG